MKILLHVCCGPCSVMVVRRLREQGHDLTAFWYNPNIHPYTEYVARRDAFSAYAASVSLPVRWRDEYGLRKFVALLDGDLSDRCGKCYGERLRETALAAKAGGFEAFASTLFVSPYQKHDLLKAVAEEVSREVGIPFLYEDFRPDFWEGRKIAKAFPLYMQKYCGCIFSEEERYLSKKS